MAENRYTKAAKATIEKHSPQAEISVMGEDPDGNRWIQTREAPGVKKYLGDTLPGGTVEGFGERSISVLPPHGGGAEYELRMGQHLDRPSKPSTEKPKEWGGWLEYLQDVPLGGRAIMDLQYPGGVPEGRPIDSSVVGSWGDLRKLASSAGSIDSYEKEEFGLSSEESQKIDDQSQREELDNQIKDANFPDPRTDEAVRGAVEDMLGEQFVGLKLLSTSEGHEDGVPDNIYFEAEDGSRWEWNSNGEIHRAD